MVNILPVCFIKCGDRCFFVFFPSKAARSRYPCEGVTLYENNRYMIITGSCDPMVLLSEVFHPVFYIGTLALTLQHPETLSFHESFVYQ